MPFVALLADGSRFCTLDHERGALPDLVHGAGAHCPSCSKPLFLKKGRTIRPHFGHYTHADAEACPGKPESAEHLEAKFQVLEMLSKNDGALVVFEFSVPDAGRIADVMEVYPSGFMHAHEIQLSPISLEDLQERTESYHALGIPVTWYFGEKVRAAANIDWCHSHAVECLSVFFDTTHIHPAAHAF